MKTVATWMAVLVLAGGPIVPGVYAQKGMGESTGIARKAVKPEAVSLSGKVTGVKTGPCEKTTGRANVGTHFLLKTRKGEKLNIHLGPADVVEHIADRLSIGKKVTVNAFRTAKMPENHYVARSLAIDGDSIRLRDEGLRPFWAWGGNSRGRGGQMGPSKGQSPGYGRGRQGAGPGWGRGPASGRDCCPRLGPGCGRGNGRGQGGGYGRGPWFIDQDEDGICDHFERAFQRD